MNRSVFVCARCAFTAYVYNARNQILCNNCLSINKEQQMTHKFKVGDRVKYIDVNANSWVGSTGTVVAERAHNQYYVQFDPGTSAYAYKSSPHNADEYELELIPMQDKVLIKPEDYYTLKKDDEVEITVKGKYVSQGISIAIANKPYNNTNYTYKDDIISLYKLTPKATKLEVGEIVLGSKGEYEVISIKNTMCLYSLNRLTHEVYDNCMCKITLKRKSGIPIGWEATFS
jgi:hypothetical protein